MQLPVRLSSAQKLLEEYSSVVDSVLYGEFGDSNRAENQLIEQLESTLKQCTIIAENMLHALGFSGNLSNMEQELSKRIQKLANETFFLNSKGLQDFIIEAFSEAIAYDPKYKQIYTDYLQRIAEVAGIDESQEDYLKIMTKLVNEEFGHLLGDNNTIIISDGTGYAASGRDVKGRYAAKVSTDFYKTSINIKKKIAQAISAEKPEQVPPLPPLLDVSIKNIATDNGFNIDMFGELSFEKILSLLKLKPTDINKLPNSQQIKRQVNEYMINYIISQSSVSNPSLLKQCIEDIISEKDTIFFVGNTAKNLTGILGEIQGLYYIRSILNDNKISSSEVSWIGGKGNPHADLLLKNIAEEYFGIQVKNTTREDAIQEVGFESFKSKINKEMINGNMNFSWVKETSENFGDTLNQNPVLFNAITGLLAMEDFNIPYIWSDNRATPADINQVPRFSLTRRAIISSAEHARKAATSFVAGMMYMQLSPNDAAGTSNTLYLIGGTLAITSASILTDIIHNLEKELTSFRVEIERVVNKKTKEKNIETIVDFLNTEGGHLNSMQYVLKSSYTFYK